MQQPGRSWPLFEEKRKLRNFRNPKQTEKEKDTENPNPETQKIILRPEKKNTAPT